MNPLQNFSKWGWWLIGGLAMAGIGGWYAFEFQSQKRQVATPPSPSVSLPLPVSPQFTDKPAVSKPAIKPTAKARKDPSQGIGGASQIPASEQDGLSATTGIPHSGAAAPMVPNAARDLENREIPAAVTRTNISPSQTSAPPARTVPVQTTTAAVSKPQRAATSAKPAPAKSQPPAQQAKVMPPAAPAPAASDDSGQNGANSTFIPEERAIFGTTPTAPSAQSYAAGNNNPLPPIEPAQIPAAPAPAPAATPSAPNSGSVAPAPDLPPESMPRPGN